MKKYTHNILIFILTLSLFSSCADYLDIVPEGVPSLETAFSNKENAEKFLYTCYSWVPNSCEPNNSVAFLGGDEFWFFENGPKAGAFGKNAFNISEGRQNTNAPYYNYWDGQNGGNNLWIAIRDCNILLDNIHKPKDLDKYERTRWIAEAKYLKAFYHYYLLQLYGPIPIMDKNIDVNAPVDEVRVFRDPIDEVVDYIVATIDSCVDDLPPRIYELGTEAGRITQPIARAMKAKVLMLAASPLFNGNPDYKNFKDKRGIQLFPQEYDELKWTKAAQASLEALESARAANHSLYQYRDFAPISDVTRTQLSIALAVSDHWNEEIILATHNSTVMLQQYSAAPLDSKGGTGRNALSILGVTFNVVEDFYTSNGVPMSEDKSTFWQTNYDDRHKPVVIPDEGDNKYRLAIGDTTAIVHLNREPRFYANIGFDRGTWYRDGSLNDTTGAVKLKARRGDFANNSSDHANVSGYYAKKAVGIESYMADEVYTGTRYSFPVIRLADLYLMYAECLNESLATPGTEVYNYVDTVRARAGLKGVVESWRDFSTNPTKPSTREGMRKIIRQERLNELSLEGQRFWDMRRWKVTPEPLMGWTTGKKVAVDFYRPIEIANRVNKYSYKEFLWPLSIGALQKNPNFVQNPGW